MQVMLIYIPSSVKDVRHSVRSARVVLKVMRGNLFLDAQKMREREREIPERTTAAAMARKQETIKANCRRSDGGTTEDGCCHIPRRNERNVKLEKTF